MAKKLLRKVDNKAHPKEIPETEAAIINFFIRDTAGTAALFGPTDSVTTSVEFGTGSSIDNLYIGNSSATTINFPGDIDVSGEFLTADNIILLNNGSGTGDHGGYVVERGGAGDDALLHWNETDDRFELGLFDTAGGTTTPGATLSTFSDLKLDDLLLDGTAITADGALTITATGGTSDLTLTGRGNSITLNEVGNTTLDGSFTATSVIAALNEVKTGAVTVNKIENSYTNGEAGSILQGQLVYVSGAATVMLADATSDNSAARVIGAVDNSIVLTGASATIGSEGVMSVRFEASLTLSAGDEIFLSTTAGAATNVKPSASGNVIQSIGTVKDVASYDGSSVLLAEVHLIPGSKVVV